MQVVLFDEISWLWKLQELLAATPMHRREERDTETNTLILSGIQQLFFVPEMLLEETFI